MEINIYVCHIYIYIYINTACVCLYVYIYMYIYIYGTCMYTYISIYTYTHICAYIYALYNVRNIHTYANTYIWVYKYAHSGEGALIPAYSSVLPWDEEAGRMNVLVRYVVYICGIHKYICIYKCIYTYILVHYTYVFLCMRIYIRGSNRYECAGQVFCIYTLCI